MINKAILLGNVGKKPALKYSKAGLAILNFSVCTTRIWFKEGNKKEDTQWHTVTVFGKRAEGLGSFLDKGQKVYIEGEIQNQSWDDKNGNKKYRTVINAQEVKVLGGNGTGKVDTTAMPPKEEMPPVQTDWEPPFDEQDVPF